MPDEPETTAPSNGATLPPEPEAKLSLREIAEQSWDEVVDAAEEPDAEGQPLQDAPARDSLGRFVAKPGEAAPPDGTQPRPQVSAPQQPPQHPAPEQPGSSSEAPANWSAEDRKTFSELPPAGQQFLLRRHSEMEGDYQRRVQANATAAQFTSALAPVFQDPVIAGSMQQLNLSPYDMIREWAGFHRRFMDPNPQVALGLLQEMAQRRGLNPAAAGQGNQPGPVGFTEADLKDPAIRTIADYFGKTTTEMQTLRGELHSMRQQEAERQNAEVLKVTRWGVDSFADEVGSDGQKLHPHFDDDEVMQAMMKQFRADPNSDIKQVYETACWMVPRVRAQMLAAQAAQAERAKQTERAKQAVRSNARGITSPVSKPQGSERKGLRATIEAAAEEVGI